MNTQPDSALINSPSIPGSLSGIMKLPLHQKTGQLNLKVEGRVLCKSGSNPAEQILKGFTKESSEFANDLCGEFLIFAELGSQAMIIRDFIGTRPFYYSVQNHQLFFACRLENLLSLLPEKSAVDEEALGLYLLDCYAFQDRSLYKNIHRLPAGHILRIKDSKLSTSCYRSADYFQSLDPIGAANPEEEFKNLLELSLERRIASDNKLGVLLSGGIDSAGITKTAANVIEQRGANPKDNLHTYSIRFEDEACDPGPKLAQVLDLVESEHLDIYPEQDLKSLSDSRENSLKEVCYYPNLFMYRKALERAHADGLSTVCTGLGGDDVFTPSPLYLADLLRTGQFASLISGLTDLNSMGIPLHTLISRYLVRPLLPKTVVKIAHCLKPDRAPSWMDTDFARRYKFQDQIFEQFSEVQTRCKTFSAEAITFRMFGWGGIQWSLEQEFEFFSALGVYPSWPLLEQELIQFACKLPIEKLYYQNEGKKVLRDAMLSYFPREVCYSDHYIDFSNLVGRMLEDQNSFAELWHDSRLIEHGIVTRTGIKKTLGRMYKEHNFHDFLKMLHAEKLLRRAE